MMREYVTPPRVRGIVAAALIAVLALGNLFAVPSVVLAEAAAKKHAPKEAVAPPPPSDDYLASLLDEINARRESVGTPPLTYATEDANEAVSQYLADLTPQMVSMNSCFHGQNNPTAPGWDYVAASGLEGEARGEVLACPDDHGFWTPDRIADGWWNSPMHFEELYGDGDANVVACGTYGPQNGGRAYQTIACVTYHV